MSLGQFSFNPNNKRRSGSQPTSYSGYMGLPAMAPGQAAGGAGSLGLPPAFSKPPTAGQGQRGDFGKNYWGMAANDIMARQQAMQQQNQEQDAAKQGMYQMALQGGSGLRQGADMLLNSASGLQEKGVKGYEDWAKQNQGDAKKFAKMQGEAFDIAKQGTADFKKTNLADMSSQMAGGAVANQYAMDDILSNNDMSPQEKASLKMQNQQQFMQQQQTVGSQLLEKQRQEAYAADMGLADRAWGMADSFSRDSNQRSALDLEARRFEKSFGDEAANRIAQSAQMTAAADQLQMAGMGQYADMVRTMPPNTMDFANSYLTAIGLFDMAGGFAQQINMSATSPNGKPGASAKASYWTGGYKRGSPGIPSVNV